MYACMHACLEWNGMEWMDECACTWLHIHTLIPTLLSFVDKSDEVLHTYLPTYLHTYRVYDIIPYKGASCDINQAETHPPTAQTYEGSSGNVTPPIPCEEHDHPQRVDH